MKQKEYMEMQERLAELCKGKEKEKLKEEVSMMLDSRLGMMHCRLIGLKQLIGRNVNNLQHVRDEERSIRKLLDAHAADISSTHLTVQDMQFFNKLFFNRTNKQQKQIVTESPNRSASSKSPDHSPFGKLKLNEANLYKSIESTGKTKPMHLLKQFDNLYNNQETRISQLIEYQDLNKYQSQAQYFERASHDPNLMGYRSLKDQKVEKQQSTMKFMDNPSNIWKETEITDRKMNSSDSFSDQIPEILNDLYTDKNQPVLYQSHAEHNHESRKATKHYFEELMKLGEDILKITDKQIEEEGIRSRKSRSEISKQLYNMGKVRSEVEAKLHIVKDLWSNAKSKRKGIKNEELFDRLAELSKPKPKLMNSEIVTPLAYSSQPAERVLIKEDLENFIQRNYKRFKEKYDQNMRNVEDRSDIERAKDEEYVEMKKKYLERVNPISPEANVLKVTITQMKKTEESQKRMKEIKDAKDKEMKLREISRSKSPLHHNEYKMKNQAKFQHVSSKISLAQSVRQSHKSPNKTQSLHTLAFERSKTPKKLPVSDVKHHKRNVSDGSNFTITNNLKYNSRSDANFAKSKTPEPKSRQQQAPSKSPQKKEAPKPVKQEAPVHKLVRDKREVKPPVPQFGDKSSKPTALEQDKKPKTTTSSNAKPKAKQWNFGEGDDVKPSKPAAPISTTPKKPKEVLLPPPKPATPKSSTRQKSSKKLEAAASITKLAQPLVPPTPQFAPVEVEPPVPPLKAGWNPLLSRDKTLYHLPCLSIESISKKSFAGMLPENKPQPAAPSQSLDPVFLPTVLNLEYLNCYTVDPFGNPDKETLDHQVHTDVKRGSKFFPAGSYSIHRDSLDLELEMNEDSFDPNAVDPKDESPHIPSDISPIPRMEPHEQPVQHHQSNSNH